MDSPPRGRTSGPRRGCRSGRPGVHSFCAHSISRSTLCHPPPRRVPSSASSPRPGARRYAEGMAGAAEGGSADRRPLVVIVIVAIGLLGGVTALLASVHGERRTALAQAHRDRGDALVARGELAAAVVEYRSALALARGHLETG